ncbi:polysaccharide deacetylase family protein [Streptomyces sp. NPDC092296]|uniref:polysaccharide deacetylase family protein n=1 Tax=Streptomyces sp. NPDC092296 TaxID=3366012 RepID=UPI003829660C
MRLGRGVVAVLAAAGLAVSVAACGSGAAPVADGTAPGGAGARPTRQHDRVPEPPPTPTVGKEIQHTLEDGGRSVGLTFDDGPDPTWTPKVLALLAQHHAKAVFCMIGPNAAAHPELVRQVVAAGHRLCDHSVHHNESQSSRSADYNVHEIVDAQLEIAKAAGPGAPLWYYRAPGGDFTPAIRTVAAEHGLRPLGWQVDSRDWQRPGAQAIVNTVFAELKPGRIVLMHDGGGDRSQSLAALRTVLDRLDSEGWTYSFPRR